MNQAVVSRNGFTLIELLITVGVVAVLSVVTILVLNPAEILRQSRDSQRLADLETIEKGMNLYEVQMFNNPPLGTNTVYISLIDPTATSTAGTDCDALDLGLLIPPGWTLHCGASSTLRMTDGTGWLPLDFTELTAKPFSSLPIDPANSSSTRHYYALYNRSGSDWKVEARLESSKHAPKTLSDGGVDYCRFERGRKLSLSRLPTSTLIYLELDEGRGTPIDCAGNYTLVPLGVEWVNGTGTRSYAMLSDGSVGDRIIATSTQDVAEGSVLTVGGWFRMAQNANFFSLISKRATANEQWRLGRDGGNSGIFQVNTVNGQVNLGDPPAWTDTSWHHFVGVYDGSLLSIYFDGTLWSTTTQTGAIANNTNNIVFAGDYEEGDFNGALDDALVIDGALSSAEVLNWYNTTRQ